MVHFRHYNNSINSLKGERAMELYGIKAKNGVLIIETKPNTKFLNFENLC